MWLSKKGISVGPASQRKRTVNNRQPPDVDEQRKRKQLNEQRKRKQLAALAASNPRPPDVDEDRKRKQPAVIKAVVDVKEKPSDVSPSSALSVDAMNVTPPTENETTFLGGYQGDVLVTSYHPGARSLQKGDTLTIEAEPGNEYDALAVRVFDKNKKPVGYLEGDSGIKPVLAALLLNPTTNNWLDRIEVTYIRREYRNRGRVSMLFFGHVNSLRRLQGAMGGVQDFVPGNK